MHAELGLEKCVLEKNASGKSAHEKEVEKEETFVEGRGYANPESSGNPGTWCGRQNRGHVGENDPEHCLA